MATATNMSHEIHLPDWYDERAREECAARGYLPGTVIEFADGQRYELYFYDPVRLGQDLAADLPHGVPCVAEVNMVVVSEITPNSIRAAVTYLVEIGYFRKIKALAAEPLADG
jgi:hypothetical protein